MAHPTELCVGTTDHGTPHRLPLGGTKLILGAAGTGRTTLVRTIAEAAYHAKIQTRICAPDPERATYAPYTDTEATTDPRALLTEALDLCHQRLREHDAPPVVFLVDDVMKAAFAHRHQDGARESDFARLISGIGLLAPAAGVTLVCAGHSGRHITHPPETVLLCRVSDATSRRWLNTPPTTERGTWTLAYPAAEDHVHLRDFEDRFPARITVPAHPHDLTTDTIRYRWHHAFNTVGTTTPIHPADGLSPEDAATALYTAKTTPADHGTTADHPAMRDLRARIADHIAPSNDAARARAVLDHLSCDCLPERTQ